MQSRVTDEMIARYLSGKATAEEEAAVLDYIAESDEHLDDLLAMTAGVEQFCKRREKKQIKPVWTIVSAAACVALLIGVGVTLWCGGQSGSPVGVTPAPAYAEMDSMVDSTFSGQ